MIFEEAGGGGIHHAGRKSDRQISTGLQTFPGARRSAISRLFRKKRPGIPLASTANTSAFGHGNNAGAFTMYCAITPDRIPTGFRNLGVALLAVIILNAAPGCASNSDLKKEKDINRIQEARIKDLEQDTQSFKERHGNRLKRLEAELRNLRGGELKGLENQMQNLQGTRLKRVDTQLKILKGNILLIKRTTGEIVKEQTSIRDAQERILFGQRKMTKLVTDELAKFARFRLEAENDLDKIRTRLGQMENLMRSSIARLPSKTRADKAFRRSNFLIVNGEYDLAADGFEAFVKKYPKDKRRAEALFRRGQALFLLRKYDHALIPFFEVLEKSPKHKLATPARWMLARALEETGDLRLARDFYAQLITRKTPYANDATRRVAFINKLFPGSAKGTQNKPGRQRNGRGKKK